MAIDGHEGCISVRAAPRIREIDCSVEQTLAKQRADGTSARVHHTDSFLEISLAFAKGCPWLPFSWRHVHLIVMLQNGVIVVVVARLYNVDGSVSVMDLATCRPEWPL